MLLLIAGCMLSGLVVSTLATSLARRLAPGWGLVDQPNARKVHSSPVPLGGGIAIVSGVLLPLAAAQGLVWYLSSEPTPPAWLPAVLAAHLPGLASRAGELWAIVAAGLVVSALGLIDDVKALRWQPRSEEHTSE